MERVTHVPVRGLRSSRVKVSRASVLHPTGECQRGDATPSTIDIHDPTGQSTVHLLNVPHGTCGANVYTISEFSAQHGRRGMSASIAPAHIEHCHVPPQHVLGNVFGEKISRRSKSKTCCAAVPAPGGDAPVGAEVFPGHFCLQSRCPPRTRSIVPRGRLRHPGPS